MFDVELLRRLNSGAALSDADVAEARDGRDYQEPAFLEATKPSHVVPNLTDPQIAQLISEQARDAVIGFEVSSRREYERTYKRPEAPAGQSGITVGIGYDLGYNSASDVRAHWKGLLADELIERLVKACGLKGPSARSRLSEFRDIIVPWDAALEVYQRSTMPRFGRKVLNTFPNAVEIKGHAFGALFSLVYNRGESLSGESRREMASIRDLMEQRAFDKVPGQIRAMKRIWEGRPGFRGVLLRRDAEAILFDRGLELMRAPAVVAGVDVAQGTGASAQSLEAVVGEDAYLGDARYYEEQPEDLNAPIGLEAVAGWESVSWAGDDDAPDYSHITDRSRSGQTFELTARALELLIRLNDFEPRRDQKRIIFALRGAHLVASATDTASQMKQVDRDALMLRDVRPNHRTQNCVIGVYDLTTGRLSGFSSSTVPHRRAVYEYKATRKAGNMMPAGCYSFIVGWHKVNQPTTVPGCLTEQGYRKAVLRSVNDLRYDTADVWENHQSHGDNLHPASSDRSAKFSSYGCLVINGTYQCDSGDRARGTHTGEWGEFRSRLGLKAPGTGDHGKKFDAIVLTGLEAAIAAGLCAASPDGDPPEARALLGRLRQGSRGERVLRLQAALGQPQTGRFDHILAKVVADRQKQETGKGDGIYSPAMDQRTGFGVFAPLPIVVASAALGAGGQGGLEAAGGSPSALEARRAIDDWHYQLGMYETASRREGRQIDDGNLEALGEVNLEFGMTTLRSIGANVARDLEYKLKDYVCRQVSAQSDDLRKKLDDAAAKGQHMVRELLITTLTKISIFIPRALVEPVVDVVINNVVMPALGTPGQLAMGQLGHGSEWLCQRWTDNIASRYAAAGGAPNDGPSASPPVAAPAVVTAVPVTPVRAGPSRIDELFAPIAQAAASERPNGEAVRRLVKDLNDEISRSGLTLSPSQTTTLLSIMSDARILQSNQAGPDLLAQADAVKAVLAVVPVDKAALESVLDKVHQDLGDARLPVPVASAKALLKMLRNARQFDQLSRMADRFISRDPAMLSELSVPYAQGLIDGGRLIAGIEVLTAAEQSGKLTLDERKEVDGLLGRAHKQIYLNFVRTQGDAMMLRDTMGPHLGTSVEHYAKHTNPTQPGTTYYHGINLVALLARAKRDGITIDAKFGDADQIARGIIAGIEPAAEIGNDAWQIVTLGEAYLAIGDFENAAKWYGRFAQHPSVSAFELNSAIRQLEELWQLSAEQTGPGAIVTGLKTVLAQKDGGSMTLKPKELRALANANVVQFASHFETKTEGGEFINFGLLKQIVHCGDAVAAVQKPNGQSWVNHGTAFLVKGSDFSPDLPDDRSYLLTNAHVMWDFDQPGHGNHPESSGLPVDWRHVRIVFESHQMDGRNEPYACARVVWQSPSSHHDAVLFELREAVPRERAAPLSMATRDCPLRVADTGGAHATRLCVLGHPGGRELALSYVGSIQQNNAILVDKGPREANGDPEFLHYSTPTEGGNSGSPVFAADTWRVVALHHAGYPEHGRPKLGGKTGSNHANEGIWIWSIRAAVKAARSGGGGERPRWWSKGRGPSA